MTRDELLENVHKYLYSVITIDGLVSAVDTYTSAIIAQSKCSTPLEVVNQLYSIEEKVLLSDTETDRRKEIAHNRQRSLIHVSQMISAMEPMA